MGYRELLKNAIELLERDERPEAESWKERAEDELAYFPITSVCREDLENKGYNTQNVDDGDMEHLASKMADAFCDGDYWIVLEALADSMDIPKHNNTPLECVAEGCHELQGEEGEYCPKHELIAGTLPKKDEE